MNSGITDSANSKPIVAVVVAHAVIVRIEVEAPCEVRIVRVERTRSVVAVGTSTVELTIGAGASSGQED